MDPLANTPWSAASTVEGFSKGQPNRVLVDYATHVLAGRSNVRALDVGCGAGRNAVPLAALGWKVVGLDLSRPMLEAAAARAEREQLSGRVALAMAPMDVLPVANASADLVVAHGIWNLAKSSAEMRRAIAEAARVARPGAALFVFTFSRNTLPADASPVPGESFVFNQFSGAPQCFLTEDQLLAELSAAGFVRDSVVPLTEYNRPPANSLGVMSGPVIYEAAFRRRAGDA